MPETPPSDLDLLAPGSRVIVRDQDWQVIGVERQALGTSAIVRCIGRSELVRDRPGSFFSDIDEITPEDPTQTYYRLDTSANGVETRLILESLIRRTPIPISNSDLTVGHELLADDLPYQREPFRMAMNQLQPRLLIADAVGLGKTIEVAMLLSELQRRGRANRVLAVVPRHILDQIQHELWCRAAFPLVRLDSEGIRRVRQKIPAGQNPFTYFNRVIVSIDTIKDPSRYRHHLERARWDVVWIDEAHSVANRSAQRARLAQVLAPMADALILSTATPHNGKPDAFADLISLLDPTAVPNPAEVTVDDIDHLVVRRHKHSADVAAVVGDRWAERADPIPMSVVPNEAEEGVFAELSTTWLNPDASAPTKDHLFAYTLLKAALSSPAALSDTIESRLTRRRLEEIKDPTVSVDRAEENALRRLFLLSEGALESGSAKLDTLIETLRGIGVGPDRDARVVIFSERIATLDWIAAAIRTELEMDDEQVQTFHNSKSEEEQQQIIEGFSMDSAPIRVLVTSDIAAEGVNLHKQCHHLIHFDLPWSLITVEQRNGRIDRYGQLKSPEIRYLIYNPDDSQIASDVRVLAKLIEKEHLAHKALGDAGSVMGLYSEAAEEKQIIAALRRQTEEDRLEALDEVAPDDAAFDPWAFVGLSGGSEDSRPEPVEVRPMPSLFTEPDDYLVAGLRLVYDRLEDVGWETDESIISFEPPPDLMQRLSALPQSYLRQRTLHERLRVTSDPSTANASLDHALNAKAEGGDPGTAWPEVHYLAPQHPVLQWLADKVLYRVDRNEAIALACDVAEPTILVSGVWSNALGEPIATVWLGATVEDDMVVFTDLFETLEAAGIGDGMINPEWSGDLDEIRELNGIVVAAATDHLTTQMEDQLEEIRGRLDDTRRRLERWQAEARALAQGIKSAPHRTRRLADIEGTSKQIEGLIADRTPADAPLIRIVGALVPREH